MRIFQSTSSARRTTFGGRFDRYKRAISIHVLREEDDGVDFVFFDQRAISIHVLREEDDS